MVHAEDSLPRGGTFDVKLHVVLIRGLPPALLSIITAVIFQTTENSLKILYGIQG